MFRNGGMAEAANMLPASVTSASKASNRNSFTALDPSRPRRSLDRGPTSFTRLQCNQSHSQSGHLRPIDDVCAMSPLPPIATVRDRSATCRDGSISTDRPCRHNVGLTSDCGSIAASRQTSKRANNGNPFDAANRGQQYVSISPRE